MVKIILLSSFEIAYSVKIKNAFINKIQIKCVMYKLIIIQSKKLISKINFN